MASRPHWTIQCSRPEFEHLACDPAFAALTNLARTVNTIQFAVMAFQPPGDDGPSAKRQRMNALMCQAAFLYEGLQAAKRIGKYFRHLPAFERLRDARKHHSVLEVEEALKRLRNTSVFHFAEDEMARHLQQFTQEPCVFTVGVGDLGLDSYHELADVAAMQGLIGSTGSQKEWNERSRFLIGHLSRAMTLFVAAANELITEGLASFDFVMVDGSHPHE